MITQKQNRAHIYFALLILTGLFLLIIIFSSCKPSLETCNKLYPPHEKDSISYVEVTKFDTSYLVIPGDTVQLKVPIPCPDFTGSASSGKGKVQVIIKDHYLTANCTSKEDSIRIVKACQEKEKMNKKTIEVKVPVYKAPTWSWWSLMFNILFIGLTIIYLRFRK